MRLFSSKGVLIRVIYYTLVPLVSLVLIGASQYQRANRTCLKVHVLLEHRGDNFFLDLESIRELIGAQDQILGARIQDIQLSTIEQSLLNTRYVEKADAWFDSKGELILKLWLNNPIARIINENGGSFYIDSEGKLIPTSEQFTARTMLIRGYFSDSVDVYYRVTDPHLRKALPVIQQLQADSLWSVAVSELLIDSTDKWSILTQFSDLRIDMGPLEQSHANILTLNTFARKILIPQGWNRYKSISLQYFGQVVAKK